MATHYLPPGQVFASKMPTRVTTIVGSSVAVCLWDGDLHVGGINHYLLPHLPSGAAPSGRFGDSAFAILLDALIELGCKPQLLKARVIGGACTIQAFLGRRDHLGRQNTEVAIKQLRDNSIPSVEWVTSGESGRKLVFCTSDGSAVIESI